MCRGGIKSWCKSLSRLAQHIKQPWRDSFSLSSSVPFLLYQLVHDFISFKWEFRDPQIQAPASSNNTTVRFYFSSRQNGIPDSILDRPGFSQWWFFFFFGLSETIFNMLKWDQFYPPPPPPTHPLTKKNNSSVYICLKSRVDTSQNERIFDKRALYLAYNRPFFLNHHHYHHHHQQYFFFSTSPRGDFSPLLI